MFGARRDRHSRNRDRLRSTLVRVPSGDRVPADEALRNPDIRLADLVESHPSLGLELDPMTPGIDIGSLDADARYVGYVRRQEREVQRASRYSAQRIPATFSFEGLPGLSRELQVRLRERRPETVGHAGSIPGMTPAAQALISAAISRGFGTNPRSHDDMSISGGAAAE